MWDNNNLLISQKGVFRVFSGWFTTKGTTKRKDQIKGRFGLKLENIFMY